MAEWGRKEYSKKWPSRTPVWTWTAILLTFVFFAGMLTLQPRWDGAQNLRAPVDLNPTPDKAAQWMGHDEEIARRVRGTEMKGGAGYFELEMAADAFPPLPRSTGPIQDER
jgi:hypothetical protein